MNMENIVVENADGWVQLSAGNIGFNVLTLGKTVSYYTSSVDVAPVAQKGDIANSQSPRLWDVGVFAWVKSSTKVDIVVYT